VTMGQRLSQDCSLCWDPEEAARQIRSKKQQKAAIQKYQDLFEDLDGALQAGDKQAVAEITAELKRHQAYVAAKSESFLMEMKNREAWSAVEARLKQLQL